MNKAERKNESQTNEVIKFKMSQHSSKTIQ